MKNKYPKPMLAKLHLEINLFSLFISAKIAKKIKLGPKI